MPNYPRFLLIFCCLLLLALPASAQQDEGEVLITEPAPGQELFGLVQISGTATHPSLFNGYVLEWRSAQSPVLWLPINSRVNQQVQDGVLGQWDTVASGVPDGLYQIRLQMFLTDGTVREYQVDNLRLVNSAPTSVPTVAPVVPQVATPLSLPTPGASPTSPIEQPPTATPRPDQAAPVIAVADDSGDSSATLNEIVNFSALQSAFCRGIFFTLGLFGFILLYLALRQQLSPYTRRLWWQIRSEMNDDQRDY